MTFTQVVIASVIIIPLLMVTQKGTPMYEKSESVRKASKGLDVLLAAGVIVLCYILYKKIGA